VSGGGGGGNTKCKDLRLRMDPGLDDVSLVMVIVLSNNPSTQLRWSWFSLYENILIIHPIFVLYAFFLAWCWQHISFPCIRYQKGDPAGVG
jgi:hypothetical protein